MVTLKLSLKKKQTILCKSELTSQVTRIRQAAPVLETLGVLLFYLGIEPNVEVGLATQSPVFIPIAQRWLQEGEACAGYRPSYT